MASNVIQYILRVSDEASPALDDVADSADGAEGGLDGAEASSAAASITFAAMAAAAIAAATAIFKIANAASEYVDQTLILSRSVGLSTDTIIAMDLALQAGGGSIDKFSMALRTFVGRAGDAADGGAEAIAAFDKIGVSVTDASGRLRNMNELLPEVINGIGALPTEAERAAVSIDILSSRGSELIAVLDGSTEGFDKWGQAAKDAGLVIDKGAIEASGNMDSALTEMNLQLKAVTLQLGQQFTPQVVEAIGDLSGMIVVIGNVVSWLVKLYGYLNIVNSTGEKFVKWLRDTIVMLWDESTSTGLADELFRVADATSTLIDEFDDLAEAAKNLEGATYAVETAGKINTDAIRAMSKEADDLTAMIEKLAGIDRDTVPTLDDMTQALWRLHEAGIVSGDAFERLSDLMIQIREDAKITADEIRALGVVQFGGAPSIDAQRGATDTSRAINAPAAGPDLSGATNALNTASQGLDGLVSLLSASGPEGALVAAIVGAVQALGDGLIASIFDGISNMAGIIGDLGGIIARELPPGLVKLIPALLDMIPAFADGIVNGLIPALLDLFTDPAFYAGIVESLLTGFAQTMVTILIDLPDAIFRGLRRWFAMAWKDIKAFFKIGGGRESKHKQKKADAVRTVQSAQDQTLLRALASQGLDFRPATSLAASTLQGGFSGQAGAPNVGGGGSQVIANFGFMIPSADGVNQAVREMQRLYGGTTGLRRASILGG